MFPRKKVGRPPLGPEMPPTVLTSRLLPLQYLGEAMWIVVHGFDFLSEESNPKKPLK